MAPYPIYDETGPELKFLRYKTLPADESEGKGDYILCFEVGDDPVPPDPSQVPTKLRRNPALPAYTKDPPEELKKRSNHRCFNFELTADGWVINGDPLILHPPA